MIVILASNICDLYCSRGEPTPVCSVLPSCTWTGPRHSPREQAFKGTVSQTIKSSYFSKSLKCEEISDCGNVTFRAIFFYRKNVHKCIVQYSTSNLIRPFHLVVFQ
jgi:hypothetical protein